MSILRRPYPSDLSDSGWEILEPLLPSEKTGGRHRGYALREIVNAIEYLIRCGGAWRSLPHDLPHWQPVYHYFRLWGGRHDSGQTISPNDRSVSCFVSARRPRRAT
ncbi:MAG: transposase [Pyrinomonadaceae bacterium]